MKLATNININTQSKPAEKNRAGMTLLEVLLAAVILASALAALSQLATNGINASLRTQLETMAAVKCQARLDEILATSNRTVFGQTFPFPDQPEWTWTAELSEGPVKSLAVLRVTVRRSGTSATQTEFSLTRLIPATTDGDRGRSGT